MVHPAPVSDHWLESQNFSRCHRIVPIYKSFSIYLLFHFSFCSILCTGSKLVAVNRIRRKFSTYLHLSIRNTVSTPKMYAIASTMLEQTGLVEILFPMYFVKNERTQNYLQIWLVFSFSTSCAQANCASCTTLATHLGQLQSMLGCQVTKKGFSDSSNLGLKSLVGHLFWT